MRDWHAEWETLSDELERRERAYRATLEHILRLARMDNPERIAVLVNIKLREGGYEE